MKEKVVYAYVVADLLHVGHVHFLENAKTCGDKLVVGVLTDEATMERKPKPTLSFSERIRLVKSLKCVDMVIAQETYSPIPNIKSIKPDVLIESSSHTEEDLKETHMVAKLIGTEIVMLPYYSEQSSTKIKNQIVREWKEKSEIPNPDQVQNYSSNKNQKENNSCGI